MKHIIFQETATGVVMPIFGRVIETNLHNKQGGVWVRGGAGLIGPDWADVEWGSLLI